MAYQLNIEMNVSTHFWQMKGQYMQLLHESFLTKVETEKIP